MLLYLEHSNKFGKMKIELVLMVVLFCLIVTAPLGCSNPEPYPPPLPVLSVASPSSTVNVHDIVLTVEVRVFAIPTIVINGSFYTEDVEWLNFSIDNQPSTAIALENKGTITPKFNDSQNPFNGDPYVLWVGKNTLSGLSDGTHTISLQGQTKYLNNTLQKFFYFTINSTTPMPSQMGEPTATQQPTPTPSVPEFSSLAIFLLLAFLSCAVPTKWGHNKNQATD
jgi:hypothetical protein